MQADSFELVASVERHGRLEGLHFGAAAVLDCDGTLVMGLGDPDVQVLGRSAWKPVQAVAMLELGLDVTERELALVCSSHSGSPARVRDVQGILANAGLGVDALSNSPGLPFDPDAMQRFLRDGGEPNRLAANCSGKHAGMLVTSARNGWPTDASYLDPVHPLQREILTTARRLAGTDVQTVGPDGCGAPTFVCGLRALADAYRRIATAAPESAERAVYDAMVAHPKVCAGRGRVATDLMEAVPGTVAKDGAEGVLVAAAPDGHAIALKIADGSTRPWRAVVSTLLARLGIDAVRIARFQQSQPGRAPGEGEVRAAGRLASH